MSGTKNIALFLPSFKSSGGAEKQITLLAQHLSRRGYNIHAFCLFSGGSNYELLKETPNFHLNALIGDPKQSKLKKLIRFLKVPFLLKTYLKQHDISILFATLYVTTFLGCLVKILHPSIKLVLGMRTLLTQNQLNIKTFYTLTKLLSSKADLMISNSKEAEKYALINGFKPKKTAIILNGFDETTFYFDENLRTKTRNSYNIETETCVIGFVGRLSPIKNIEFLLQAVAKIKNIKIMLVGVGEESYQQKLKQLCETLKITDHVIFCGEQKNLINYYSAFDLFIIPSKTESFPNVLAEAMLCETPYLVSNLSSMKEIIENKDKSFNLEDTQELTKKIKDFIETKPFKRNSKAREKILHNYTISSMISAYEDLFKTL